MEKVRYAMVIDQRRCTGCHACAIACKSENNMPSKVSLNVVIVENSTEVDIPGTGWSELGNTCTLNDFNRAVGTPHKDFYTRACQHCEDAPCVKHCPTNATMQREDGLVVVDPSICTGCEVCMRDCPYGYGTMRVWIRNPEYPEYNTEGLEFGSQEAVPNTNNTVKKCTFCAHRIDRGEQPFCVEQCPSRARYFGDLNDDGSKVAQLIRNNAGDIMQIAAEEGATATQSSVYFIRP